VTCQYRQEPHYLDDECVNVTDVPWTPGAGWERVKRTMPGMVPDLTDEDMRKADEIIAVTAKRCPRCGGEALPLGDVGVCVPCAADCGWDPHCEACAVEARDYRATRVDHIATCGPGRLGSAPASEEPARPACPACATQPHIEPDANHIHRTDYGFLLYAPGEVLGFIEEVHARGVSEGRRQATEGWKREWGVDLHGRGAQCVLDEHAARGIVAGCPDDLDPKVFARLAGPWEPAEQPARELSAVEAARRCATCRHRRDWHEAKTTLGVFLCVGDVGECACMVFVDRPAEQPEGSNGG
jgi:hypothetical protein